jgi:hypothetical protein
VYDYFVGVYKSANLLPWNEMSVIFEPVNRFIPTTVPGSTSDSMLESGLQGSFLKAFLGDFMVLLAILWHTHVLRVRGVWLSRDPDMFNDQHPKEHASDSDNASPAHGKGNSTPSGTTQVMGTPSSKQHVTPMEADDGDRDDGAVSPTPTLIRKGTSSSSSSSSGPSSAKASLLQKHWSSWGRKMFREWCMAFSPSMEPRAKPGCDLYVPMCTVQVLSFLYVLLSYQQVRVCVLCMPTTSCHEFLRWPWSFTRSHSMIPVSSRLLTLLTCTRTAQAEHLFQSVRENQLSGGFILVLLLHFVLIVVDRCLYLHRAARGKIALQVVLLFATYALVHSSFTFRIGINQHGPIFVWYLFMCLYFFISALQISYGKGFTPPSPIITTLNASEHMDMVHL